MPSHKLTIYTGDGKAAYTFTGTLEEVYGKMVEISNVRDMLSTWFLENWHLLETWELAYAK